jgi:type I restriction enzyme, S subunit
MSDDGVWPLSRLGDVVEVKYGKGLPQPKRTGGHVSVYGSNGIVGQHDVAITHGPTIIVGRKGSSGAVNFSQTPCWPIDTTYYIDDPGPYAIEFLDYLLRSLGLTELDRSTAIPGLNREQLYDIEVPVPPLAEQAAIVEVLRRLASFSGSTAGHLSAARGVIERFRQSVLAAACSGGLTADWRDRDHPDSGADLLADLTAQRERASGRGHKKIVPPRLDPLDIPDAWAVSSLDRVSARVTSGSRDWSRFYGRGTGTFVMAQNVRRGTLDWSFRQAVDPPSGDPSRDRSQIELGDLLVTIVGANTGDVGPVTEHRPEHYVCQSVALVRPVDKRLTPFLNLWFNSPQHGRGYFNDCIYGAGRPHLSFDQIKASPVGLPHLSEQEEIVRRVDQLLALASGLTQRIDAASTRIDRSSQAVLAKAFRGDLTPGLPDGSTSRAAS